MPVPTNFLEVHQRLLALEGWDFPLIHLGNAPPTVFNSATWAWLPGASGTGMSGYEYNSSLAINDGGAWNVTLSKGTWNLTVIANKAATAGQLTVDISYDGGTTWTTVINASDLGGTAALTAITATGISVPVTGRAIVRYRCLGKSAGTGYLIALIASIFERTA